MQQATVTLIVAGLGIGGTLGGIVVGHVLTRSWQRKQWILDNRKEEFRELLTALAESLRIQMTKHAGALLNASEQKALIDAQAMVMRTIRDRIFIANDVERLNIENVWSAAVMSHHRTLDITPLAYTYRSIRDEVVKAATEK